MTELLDKNGLTEEQFLRQYDPDKYPKPMLTADIVIFRSNADMTDIRVLLIKRKGHPYLGFRALPGGFSGPNETIRETAARELMEETGLAGHGLDLVGVYSAPGRDPRGWVVSVAYAALLKDDTVKAVEGDDAADAEWFPLERGEDGTYHLNTGSPEVRLAFDHDQIIKDAINVVFRNR